MHYEHNIKSEFLFDFVDIRMKSFYRWDFGFLFLPLGKSGNTINRHHKFTIVNTLWHVSRMIYDPCQDLFMALNF